MQNQQYHWHLSDERSPSWSKEVQNFAPAVFFIECLLLIRLNLATAHYVTASGTSVDLVETDSLSAALVNAFSRLEETRKSSRTRNAVEQTTSNRARDSKVETDAISCKFSGRTTAQQSNNNSSYTRTCCAYEGPQIIWEKTQSHGTNCNSESIAAGSRSVATHTRTLSSNDAEKKKHSKNEAYQQGFAAATENLRGIQLQPAVLSVRIHKLLSPLASSLPRLPTHDVPNEVSTSGTRF